MAFDYKYFWRRDLSEILLQMCFEGSSGVQWRLYSTRIFPCAQQELVSSGTFWIL